MQLPRDFSRHSRTLEWLNLLRLDYLVTRRRELGWSRFSGRHGLRPNSEKVSQEARFLKELLERLN
jgi:hypothetical protein